MKISKYKSALLSLIGIALTSCGSSSDKNDDDDNKAPPPYFHSCPNG